MKELNNDPVDRWTTTERQTWMRWLFFGTLNLYASRTLLPIASPSIADELGWNRTHMGLILGMFFWGYAIPQILAGYLSDKLGGERVIPITSLGWSLITALFPFLPRLSHDADFTYHLFVFARLLLGLFQGFFYPSLASLMDKRVRPSDRNFTYAVLNAGAHLGTLFCGFFGSLLVSSSGWRAPFLLIGFISLIWSSVMYTEVGTVQSATLPLHIPIASKEPVPTQIHSSPTLLQLFVQDKMSSPFRQLASDSDPAAKKLKSPEDEASSSSPSRSSLKWTRLLCYSPFWAMLLANFSHNTSFYIILNWCPTYFDDNFPDAQRWVFNVVPWLIIFPSVIIGGLSADRMISRGTSITHVRKFITALVLFGSSFFLILLCHLDSYYGSLACMSLGVAFLGFHSSGVLLNPQDMAPLNGGQLYGIMSTVGALPGFFGVYFAGYILEQTHQWSTVFQFTALFSILSGLVYMRYGSSEPVDLQ